MKNTASTIQLPKLSKIFGYDHLLELIRDPEPVIKIPKLEEIFDHNSRVYWLAWQEGIPLEKALNQAKAKADKVGIPNEHWTWPSETLKFHWHWSDPPEEGEFSVNGIDATQIMAARNIPIVTR